MSRKSKGKEQGAGNKSGALSRRSLLRCVAALGLSEVWPIGSDAMATDSSTTSKASASRIEQAYQIRVQAAELQRKKGAILHATNSDEQRYTDHIASYSKGLPHNKKGEVEPGAFEIFVGALQSGDPYQLERIPLGGYTKLANPQGAWAFDLVGPDCSQLELASAPAFASAEQAGEMCELYWRALAADVPFAEYETNDIISKACEDLSRLSDFRGPKSEGSNTAETIFRGPFAGCLPGPHVSQFLLRDIPLSPVRAAQKIRTALPGISYASRYEDWLNLQNGALAGVNEFDPQPRYIRSGRDLGEYVHRDFTYQAFVCAALMLFNMGASPDGGNPYKYSRTQSGFVTFGSPYVFQLIAIVTSVALKAVWFHKWLMHRRLRPEEFAGRVHNQLTKQSEYQIHSDLLNSAVVKLVLEKTGSYLLPLAYPEGCPLHPSYPAGHAAIAGACATALKACFDESYVVPNPVVSSSDGLSLVPHGGMSLTVGGELHKLAANIALGRDFAEVHWRSDSIEGIKLGEEAAIRVLQEMKLTGNELFSGFSLTKFDGSKVTI